MSEITPETLERLKLQLQYAHTIQMKALRPFRQGLNDALQQFSDKREEFAIKEVVDLLNKALEPEPFFASFIINLAFGPLAGALVQGFTSSALRPILGQRKVFTIKTKVKIEGQKVPKGSTGKKYKYEFPDKETLNSLGIKIKKQGKKKASAVL
ncbi:MAG: hypothetical protein KDC44_23460, partial [Phaeodactylibacter sp.]|nr:hypothetical protein [Phaeodactylibacter sp.]